MNLIRALIGMRHYLAFSLVFLKPASADIIYPPALNPGQQFRFAFVTNGADDSADNDIETYDNFVRSEAATNADLDGITWYAFVESFYDPSVVDIIPDFTTSIPVFALDGALLSNDLANARQSGWSDALTTQFVGPGGDSRVWTGFGSVLGAISNFSTVGLKDATGVQSVNLETRFVLEEHSFYGVSEIITVPVPEPSTLTPAISGLVSLCLTRIRRRSSADRRRLDGSGNRDFDLPITSPLIRQAEFALRTMPLQRYTQCTSIQEKG
eukprot:Plantae.Rhodophyta-Purpureofilum_apyrenoidigerum.ctg10772.p1 GENE.Plantae.Rhodophyta-Purpureofilum_apyrenoidigerum.ctg10772~~Plantae.Rhodophyta-Purpureofilum_apyrenoidigerum.ctg10772.p1  ORF type:complete len:268 (+),score=-2.45 Plantae.Rhodophyta-Purpureofilum_apyrenoidigerum.ctg10772:265-1068(+)